MVSHISVLRIKIQITGTNHSLPELQLRKNDNIRMDFVMPL
jgi:hypothetical protein